MKHMRLKLRPMETQTTLYVGPACVIPLSVDSIFSSLLVFCHIRYEKAQGSILHN